MGFMMFCALFNYTILRDIKDSLVVNSAGAEAISFAKFWVVLPFSILFVLVYTKCSNFLTREQLFYYTVLVFLIFFAIFGWVLYPTKHYWQPDKSTVDTLIAAAPAFRWFIRLYAHWVYILFYAFAEMWGSVILSLLFWQFANQITQISEAKRYYAMLGLIGNLGLIISGQTLKGLTIYGSYVSGENAADPFGVTMKYITGIFTFFGFLFIYLYYWMNKNVLSDSRLYNKENTQSKKNKPKLSLGDSLRLLISSKYLLLIFTLIMSYGIAINLIEVTWKKQLGHAFPNNNDYVAFMGDFSSYTGAITIIFMLIGTNIMRVFGWLTAAIITPIMLLVTALLFFSTILFPDFVAYLTTPLAITPLVLGVVVGGVQNVLTKASKYSLFDSTKEMAYIPLSDDLKVKGKAAVDVIGGRYGKSMGSLIQQVFLMTVASGLTNGQEIIAPYLIIILVIVIIMWIAAVLNLNKNFSALNKKS
jgi:AAA family ATP:ADP antiporter